MKCQWKKNHGLNLDFWKNHISERSRPLKCIIFGMWTKNMVSDSFFSKTKNRPPKICELRGLKTVDYGYAKVHENTIPHKTQFYGVLRGFSWHQWILRPKKHGCRNFYDFCVTSCQVMGKNVRILPDPTLSPPHYGY